MKKLWLPGDRTRARLGHASERLGLDRRAFLAAGAALALGGCNSRGPRSAERMLASSERWNERVERALFRHTAMNVPPARAQLAGGAFPSYFVSASLPVWDEAEHGVWRLEIGGLVRRPVKLTLAELRDLPRAELRLEHFCVEGWSAVSVKTGVLLAELARRADVHPDARVVDFESFDDGYHESWDLDSALHPQTLIVYGQDGRLLDPAYGAPARVYSPVKLGYKNTKYLTRITFLPQPNGGYWSDQGYEWYAGV